VTPEGDDVRRRISEVLDQHMEDVLHEWSKADRADLARLLSRLVDDLRSAHYRTVADERIA
jgi:DNA-binding MarR family transcriptional regulator